MAEDDASASVDSPPAPAMEMPSGERLFTTQKSFHKAVDRVIAMADVLLEVLDARDPVGCRCRALEAAALAHRTAKKIVFLLNKADLVPPENLSAWVRYLRRFHPTVAFNATGSRRHDAKSTSDTGPGPSGPCGEGRHAVKSVDDLIGVLKALARSDSVSKAITVGVVGYPNVGKSSVINALKRSRAVTTGAKPGVTKALQTVALDRKIKLVDCPGVIFATPKTPEEEAEMVLRNALELDALRAPELAVSALLRRCSKQALRERYGIGEFGDADELLALLAFKRGFLRKGGAVDPAVAARVLIQDWNTGLIPYHTDPPKAGADEPAPELLAELAPAFDLDSLEQPAVEVATKPSSKPAARTPVGAELGLQTHGEDVDPEVEGSRADRLLGAMHVGTVREANGDEHMAVAEQLPRNKGEAPTEYDVPATQRQLQKRQKKREIRQMKLETQGVLL